MQLLLNYSSPSYLCPKKLISELSRCNTISYGKKYCNRPMIISSERLIKSEEKEIQAIPKERYAWHETTIDFGK